MDRLTRRETIAIGAGGLTAAGLIGQPAYAAIPVANVPLPKHPIEAGATLRVIRPAKFVDPDEVIWNENAAKFTKATGIPVRTDYLGWEDIRAQVAVAARTGAGPVAAFGPPALCARFPRFHRGLLRRRFSSFESGRGSRLGFGF